MNKLRFSGLLGLVAAGILSGCDEGARSPDYLPVLDKIEVCAAPLTGVCPDRGCTTANAVLAAGRSQQFCAVGFYTGISNDVVEIPRSTRNITDEVLWESSLTSVAAISAETGLANAVAEGTTQVLASASGVMGTSQLRVTEPELESISIDPPFVNGTVPGVITRFSCTGEYSNDGCPGSNPELCDLTSVANWSSTSPGVASIGNAVATGTVDSKGIMTARAPGSTDVSCAALNLAGEPVRAEAPVQVCDATLRSGASGLQLTAGGVVIDPDVAQIILPSQSVSLGLLGTFINQDPDCGDIGTQFTLDLTESANWVADRTGIVTVGNVFGRNKGIVQYIAPGLVEVSATFAGSTASVPFIAVDASVRSLTVTGPEYLFAPGAYAYTAEALYELADGETVDTLPEGCSAASEGSQDSFLCNVTNNTNIVWTTARAGGVSAAGVAEIFNNDGQLVVAADAEPQIVTVSANYLGRVNAVESLIVPATLTNVLVAPSAACITSGTLGLGEFIGSPSQQKFHARHIYEIRVEGQEEPLSCGVDGSEASTWEIPVESFAGDTQSGGDLLDILNLGGLLPLADILGLSDCQPILPVGVTDTEEDPETGTLTAAPAFVSNQSGQRGLVTANTTDILGLIPNLTVGTACVQANAGPSDAELGGQGTVIVAIDVLPEVCGLLDDLLLELFLADGEDEENCQDVLAALADEAADETETEPTESGSSGLGALLGVLLGGTR